MVNLFPGTNLSILRQVTTVEAGRPLLISGRFTAFGLGLPALIRVYVEGPSYAPEVRNFDTFSMPWSGDYSVNILAEKDGDYEVYAQAFPPPLLPVGPPFPEAIPLGPPLAESPSPPIVVGRRVWERVEALLPTGERVEYPAPPLTPVEIYPVIAVTPVVRVEVPRPPRPVPPPPRPAPPPAPVPPPVAPPPEGPEYPTPDMFTFPIVE